MIFEKKNIAEEKIANRWHHLKKAISKNKNKTIFDRCCELSSTAYDDQW